MEYPPEVVDAKAAVAAAQELADAAERSLLATASTYAATRNQKAFNHAGRAYRRALAVLGARLLVLDNALETYEIQQEHRELNREAMAAVIGARAFGDTGQNPEVTDWDRKVVDEMLTAGGIEGDFWRFEHNGTEWVRTGNLGRMTSHRGGASDV